jgi:hypothetical protein
MTTKHSSTVWDEHEGDPSKGKDKEAAAPEKAPVAEGYVRVRCIVDSFPWTDSKGLLKDEEVDVTEDVAKIMLAKKQVEKV